MSQRKKRRQKQRETRRQERLEIGAEYDYELPVRALFACEDLHPVDWSDYSELGLNSEHIPDLIRLATDWDLHWGEAAEEDGTWAAPVHAWRALAQLRAVEAVEPLLEMYYHFIGDDVPFEEWSEWVSDEIPRVFATIGPPAIPAIKAFLADESRGSSPRDGMSEALTWLVKRHPEAREECIAILTAQLECFETQHPQLNAGLINALADLEATEAGPLVERVFRSLRFDYERILWEDVQDDLGLPETTDAWREEAYQPRGRANYPPPVGDLLTFGDAHDISRTYDYVGELGLGPEHIPDLIQVVQNFDLHWIEGFLDYEWAAPIHAWRALGALRAGVATELLLQLLYDRAADDLPFENWIDWVSEEIPRVLARIGPPIIPKLSAYMADPSRQMYPRAAVADALRYMVNHYPEAREECIAALVKQMEHYQTEDTTLNGFIVIALCDLKATEAGPLVDRAFQAGCIDEEIIDREDAQDDLDLPELEKPQESEQEFRPRTKKKAKRKKAKKSRR